MKKSIILQTLLALLPLHAEVKPTIEVEALAHVKACGVMSFPETRECPEQIILKLQSPQIVVESFFARPTIDLDYQTTRMRVRDASYADASEKTLVFSIYPNKSAPMPTHIDTELELLSTPAKRQLQKIALDASEGKFELNGVPMSYAKKGSMIEFKSEKPLEIFDIRVFDAQGRALDNSRTSTRKSGGKYLSIGLQPQAIEKIASCQIFFYPEKSQSLQGKLQLELPLTQKASIDYKVLDLKAGLQLSKLYQLLEKSPHREPRLKYGFELSAPEGKQVISLRRPHKSPASDWEFLRYVCDRNLSNGAFVFSLRWQGKGQVSALNQTLKAILGAPAVTQQVELAGEKGAFQLGARSLNYEIIAPQKPHTTPALRFICKEGILIEELRLYDAQGKRIPHVGGRKREWLPIKFEKGQEPRGAEGKLIPIDTYMSSLESDGLTRQFDIRPQDAKIEQIHRLEFVYYPSAYEQVDVNIQHP